VHGPPVEFSALSGRGRTASFVDVLLPLTFPSTRSRIISETSKCHSNRSKRLSSIHQRTTLLAKNISQNVMVGVVRVVVSYDRVY
jgi:hypothetical protein